MGKQFHGVYDRRTDQMRVFAAGEDRAGGEEEVLAGRDNADTASRKSLGETIRIVRQRAGHEDDEEAIAGMIEVVATLFEGLLLRTLRHPQLDHAQLTLQVQAAIENVLAQPS